MNVCDEMISLISVFFICLISMFVYLNLIFLQAAVPHLDFDDLR